MLLENNAGEQQMESHIAPPTGNPSPRHREESMNIHKRFKELAIKHALATATPIEMAKLDRLEKLRRQPLSATEIHRENESIWQLRTLRKKLGAALFATMGRDHFLERWNK
jgi:hypothetical protein